MKQHLPNQLLQDYCKKEKRPLPLFKNISTQPGLFKFRVTLPDPRRDVSKDIHFVSANAVPNEELAKEEACLLALLNLQPSVDHERKLSEPYRTTWLRATGSLSQYDEPISQSTNRGNMKEPPGTRNAEERNKLNDLYRSPLNGGNAVSEYERLVQASTHLHLEELHSSAASERQRKEEMWENEVWQQRNAKIRRHEAKRIASQNHQVVMSARMRKCIEQFLRDGTIKNEEKDDEENLDDFDKVEVGEINVTVQNRLLKAGFTRKQIARAYGAIRSPQKRDNLLSKAEKAPNDLYEDCLQWLLVHLNEDQLPEGFDLNEFTLDVIVPGAKPTQQGKSVPIEFDLILRSADIAKKFGLDAEESKFVAQKSMAIGKDDIETFWSALVDINSVSSINDNTITISNTDTDAAITSLIEELETLDAIFGAEHSVNNSDEIEFTTIVLPFAEESLNVEIVVAVGRYPKVPPERVCVWGNGWSSQRSRISVAVHIELMKFMSNFPKDEPMIFRIYSHTQELLNSASLLEIPLLPVPDDVKTVPESEISSIDPTKEGMLPSLGMSLYKQPMLRPKDRKQSFWTVPPNRLAAAQSFPKLSRTLSNQRTSLPAAQARDEFLNAMELASKLGRVLLVTGETGSGKSTQLPAYILENDPVRSKIVVTQPRRIAATGVASRVAEERGERSPGVDSVGYVVRGDSAVCNRTRLLFCTTGVLLRQLQNEGALECISHIVVDEVHERGLDSDILLGLLKSYLPQYPNLHIVLMSATLDVDRFTNYFDGETPHIHIPGRTFPVTDFSLEDVLSVTGYIPPRSKKKMKSKLFQYESFLNNSDSDGDDLLDERFNESIEDIVNRIDESVIDYELMATLIKLLINSTDPSDDGSILVFLPGVQEINNAMKIIKQHTEEMSVTLLPLHGGLQPKEQSRVFPNAAKGFTKVILSTNVAETSVTIPDCTIVIDSAREKQSSYDPANRMPLLLEQFASKASLQQRRGRAGRVRSGVCYKLISKSTMAKLKRHSKPEIQRVALDQTILQLLFLGVERGDGSFLGTLLDPPNKESIDAAIFCLVQLGAVEKSTNSGQLRLTPMGAHLAGIPAPPIVGKMLVMGSILGCRDAALAMAAGMSGSRSPILRLDTSPTSDAVAKTRQKRVMSDRASLMKPVGRSDHAYIALLVQKWKSTPTRERQIFTNTFGLSYPAMKDIAQLYDQLESALVAAGFPRTVETNVDSNNWRIVQACAVSAMAPGQLVKVQRPPPKNDEAAKSKASKDKEARELKFYIRTDTLTEALATKEKELEVFIHPSSINFNVATFSCPFLVFNSLVTTSKPYLRDVTECSTYALLLFGGPLDVQASKGIIMIDGWAQLRANARIGSLIGGLRKVVDSLLHSKILDPSLDLSSTPEMKLIVQLLKTDGLGDE